MLETSEKLLTIHDVAQQLVRHEQTIYSMVASHQIPHFGSGRSIRFRQADIDEYLRGTPFLRGRERAQGPTPEPSP